MCMFSAFLIFRLPFIVPSFVASNSESYILGFNNSVAVAGILIAIGLFFVWGRLVFYEKIVILKNLFLNVQKESQLNLKDPIFIGFILFYVFSIAILFFGLQGPYYHGEADYFIKRIYLMDMGLFPYKNFEFIYGPFLLYLPFYLYKTLGIFGVSLRMSYFIFYGFASLVGVYLVFYLINKFSISKLNKKIIFFIMALLAWNLAFGLNYIVIRFLTSYVVLFYIHDFIRDKTSFRFHGNDYFASLSCLPAGRFITLKISLMLVGAVLLEILISPEMGAIFFIALLIYMIFSVVYDRRKIFILLFYPLLASFLIFILPQQYIQAIIVFSGGYGHLPIYPSFPVLIYLFSLFFLLTILLNLINLKQDDNVPLYAALVVLVVLLIPPALGRADPGHIFWNGLGLFVLTFAVISKISRQYFKIYSILFFAIFFSAFLLIIYISESLPAALYSNLGKYVIPEKALFKIASVFKFNLGEVKHVLDEQKDTSKYDYSCLNKYPSIAVPLRVDGVLFDYLAKTKKLNPEYYLYFEDISGEDRVKKKIEDLDKNVFVLIPKKDFDSFSKNEPANYLAAGKELSFLLLFPVNYEPKNKTIDLFKEFMTHLSVNYRKISMVGNYYLFKRKF